jgi:aspartokinase
MTMSLTSAPPGHRTVVIKLGGSVLRDLAAYRTCATQIRDRLITQIPEQNSAQITQRNHPQITQITQITESADSGTPERLVVVVSARFGVTDELLRLATEACDAPDARTLDLLWATGELQSVALLTLCLHDVGVSAIGLNVHELGLSLDGRDRGTRINALRLQASLARHQVVVVPGFLARGPGDALVSLGRGGSDLTAVGLAAALGAPCELIKDVPGYFTADPHTTGDARPLPEIDAATALAMADEGCDLVQRQALEAADAAGVLLVVRSLDAAATSTRVHPSPRRASRIDSDESLAESYVPWTAERLTA